MEGGREVVASQPRTPPPSTPPFLTINTTHYINQQYTAIQNVATGRRRQNAGAKMLAPKYLRPLAVMATITSTCEKAGLHAHGRLWSSQAFRQLYTIAKNWMSHVMHDPRVNQDQVWHWHRTCRKKEDPDWAEAFCLSSWTATSDIDGFANDEGRELNNTQGRGDET